MERIFEEYDFPVWFVTFNTHHRVRLLANDAVHARFRWFATGAAQRHIVVGRYVLMPDHVHFFVAGPREFDLSAWVRALKLALSSRIERPGPHWQEGCVDHLLREPEAWPCVGEYAALPFA